MNTLEILVLALALAVVGLVVWMLFGAPRYILKRKLARFAGRTPFGDDEFYDSYYKSSGLEKDIVTKLRQELGDILSLPPGILQPADRFDSELAVVQGWQYSDDSPDELFLANREREK